MEELYEEAMKFLKSFRHPIKNVSDEFFLRGLEDAVGRELLDDFCKNHFKKQKKELPRIENIEKVNDTCRFYDGIRSKTTEMATPEKIKFIEHICAELRYQRSQSD